MYAFCPSSCDPTGNETNSKWTEFNFGIYRASDVTIGGNVFPDSKLYIDGNVDITGNLQTNGFYFGNVALTEGLPVSQDSKWSESSGDIFRDSLVSIGQNSVNTAYDLFVNGNANISLGVESPFLLTTGNVDTMNLNVSGNVEASYFKGDAGGMGNITGGVGSRWIETIGGDLYRMSKVGIKVFRVSTDNEMSIRGKMDIQNGNKLTLSNFIKMDADGGFVPDPPSSNAIRMGGISALQVGGQEGNLVSGNFMSENQLHTAQDSYFSHLSLTNGEQNIRYAVLGVRGENDFDTIINTIDAPFQVLSAFVEGRLTISTIKASGGGKDIPNGKRVNVMLQTCNQAGFNFANVVQGLPLLTNNDEVVFTVQTGEYETEIFPVPDEHMINSLKQFMCLIWLNDF